MSSERTQTTMKSNLLRYILFLVLITGITLAVYFRDQFGIEQLQAWLDDMGIAAPIIFIAIYALATVFFLPGSILTLAGGAIFGPFLGTFCNLTGATIGATFSFLASRYLASDWVAKKTGGTLKKLIKGVEREGWRFIAFVRLVPLFPFNILNYALGLSKINIFQYIVATYIFMLPGAIAYTYIGYVGREAAAGGEDLIQKIMIALALLAIAAFLPGFIKKMRGGPTISIDELKYKIDHNEDCQVLDVRKPEDYAGEQGHIAGSKNIALEEIENRMNEVSSNLEQTILLVCRTDRRSAEAAKLLTQKGFTGVFVVKGGMTDWNKSGFPVNH